ncbi:MAG TPA: hypothetical protein G4O15_11015 [Dehalococcoidia bacterium]|nr:hypothetical protein [Dehalococcoidia bacterium]
MDFRIRDRVIYEDEEGRIKGEIVDIWKNNSDVITCYLVALDSGIYVQFTPKNLKWSKAQEPVLIA